MTFKTLLMRCKCTYDFSTSYQKKYQCFTATRKKMKYACCSSDSVFGEIKIVIDTHVYCNLICK